MPYLGIDLGGTNIAAGIIDEKMQIIGRGKEKTSLPCSQEELCVQLAAAAQSAVENAGVSWQDVPFVGVGCPGSINPQTGTVAFSPNLFCQDFPLQVMLEAKLKKPVFVENDANAAALGEWYAGALQGAEHALAITLGTGVGCGILIHGKLYRGSNFAAGEMGHMVIQAGGRPCHCGRKGCWERYASATGLKQTTREFLLQTTPATAPILWDTIEGDPKNIGGRTAFEAMRAGDPVGKAIVEQYLDHLGCGLVNAINIFEPDILCIGGGVSHEGEALLLPLQDYIRREQYPAAGKETKVCLAKLGNDAGLIGAALLGKQTMV